MKIITTILTTLITAGAFAQEFNVDDYKIYPDFELEKESFGYVGFGLGPNLPLPNLRLGFRHQKNHHGFDAGVNVATVLVLSHVTGFVNYLYYPTPDKTAQFYFGAGISGGPWIYEKVKATAASGHVILGREFQSEKDHSQFFQADIAYPYFFDGKFVSHFPLVTFTYGFGF